MEVLKKRKEYIHLIYLVGFIVALHTALPSYINSTFLGTFASEQMVGLVFSLGSLIGIFGFALMPSMLQRFGNFYTTVSFSVLASILTFILALSNVPALVIGAFILYSAIINLIWFNFDLLLESFSENSTTGQIRGLYLTATNIAWVISPSIAGFLLGSGTEYGKVYITSAVLVLIALPIFASKFSEYHDPNYNHPPFWKTLQKIFSSKEIAPVFMTTFLLRFFYAWMVIYTPIYLNQHLGIPWGTVGLIFTIMLLPFISS